MNCKQEREKWVDVLRGFAVFCVILGHLYTGYCFHLIINPIKMPLFYFIAGYVTKENFSMRTTLLKRARGLFVPMIVFSLVPIRIIYYLISGNYEVLNSYIWGYALGTINWFIYSFFISSFLFLLLIKITKSKLWTLGLVTCLCFGLGVVLKDNFYLDIWCINTALTSLLYMYGGYVVKRGSFRIINNPLVAGVCGVVFCLLIGISVIAYPGETINFHLCDYYNILICLTLSFCGIIVMRFLTIHLLGKSHSLIWEIFASFGQNTIVVYLTSSTFNAIVLAVVRKILHINNLGFGICFGGALFSCTMGYLVSIICRKFFPALMGIERRH